MKPIHAPAHTFSSMSTASSSTRSPSSASESSWIRSSGSSSRELRRPRNCVDPPCPPSTFPLSLPPASDDCPSTAAASCCLRSRHHSHGSKGGGLGPKPLLPLRPAPSLASAAASTDSLQGKQTAAASDMRGYALRMRVLTSSQGAPSGCNRRQSPPPAASLDRAYQTPLVNKE